MKKLLSLLGVVAISASSIPLATASGVISYNNGTKNWVKKELNSISTISAEIMKTGVLADQNLTVTDNKAEKYGLDMGYTTEYFGNRSAKEVFGNSVFDSKQGAGVTDSAKVADIYASIFGGDYTFSFTNFINKNVVTNNKNSRISKILNGSLSGDALDAQLKQPDASVAKTLGIIAGGGSIVFKNDWDTSIASIITGALKTNVVKEALSKDKISKIITSIDEILNKPDASAPYLQAVDKLVETINQSKLAGKKISIQSQLTSSSENLAKGLIYFISKGKSIFNEANTNGEQGKADDAATALWKYIFNKDDADLKDAAADGSDKVNAITNIVDFAFATLHYMKMFRAEIDGAITKSDLSRVQPKEIDQLFSTTKSNELVIQTINELPYGPSVNGTNNDKSLSSSLWTEQWDADTPNKNDQNAKYTAKANIQHFFSELEYYLNPTSSGYNILSLLNMLLNHFSPIRQTLIEDSLIPTVGDFVSSIVSKYIDKIPDIGPLTDIKNKLKQFINEAPGLAVNSIIDWLINDNKLVDQWDNVPKEKAFIALIGNIVSLFGKLDFSNMSVFKGIDKDIVDYLNFANQIAKVITTTGFMDHPWTVLYKGSIIGDLGKVLANAYKLFNNKKLQTTITSIGYLLFDLKNLSNVLGKMSINDILVKINNSGILDEKQFNLPDWLYNLRSMKFYDLIKSISDNFNVDKIHSFASQSLQQNNKLELDLGALSSLVNSLRANQNADENRNMQIIDDDSGKPVGLLSAFVNVLANSKKSDSVNNCSSGYEHAYTIKYLDSEKNIMTTKVIMDKDSGAIPTAVDWLFGLKGDSFIQGSLFYEMSKVYGHNFIGKDGNTEEHPEMANGIRSIFSLLLWFSNLANESIANLTKDRYMKYLDDKRWRISNQSQYGLDKNNTDQHIKYTLSFFNVDDNQWHSYNIELVRNGSITNNDGFVLKQMIRLN